MGKVLCLVAGFLSIATVANAGLRQWTSESEADPFSGGKKVTVDYMDTLRSGVLISCDTAERGMQIRAIPGFDYVSSLALVSPSASFAIDGSRLFDADGQTAQVGNNLAAVNIDLDTDHAFKFTKAFASSKKQIAIQDGISDKPHLLAANGSTKAGKLLLGCLEAQKSDSSEQQDNASIEKDTILKPETVQAILKAVQKSAYDASKDAGGAETAALDAGKSAQQVVRKLLGLQTND
ncbi:hypothetical protein [Ochrobactrum sp. AN78]|uniref:hypothetical protein n=1 Tax=Ochrobactrum sp. AN78 TaxID=3039853 RepID=UPI002989DD36|nr:hypothetical protein [Ochrobactrum sp. AN78]MDH7789153.1 hypothetical protein [Ochrobactrum sp. AN78]